MNMCRILVDSFADLGLTNAQMSNAREIVRRLDPERFHVTIFHVAEPDNAVANRSNTTLIRLPKRRQTAWILERFICGSQDIIFYLKASPAAKWYLKLRRPRSRCVTVGTVESRSDLRRQPSIAPEAVRLWEQTILRSDKLFSNSRAVQQNLESEYGLGSAIVPTGVDTKFFVPGDSRAGNRRPRVLFVGSLRPLKQPAVVLAAAARFPQADFAIAGDGPLRRNLQERIERERIANVELLGPLAPELLRRQYQSADIFLFPSIWEGSPKVMLEAAACGLPVIAFKSYEPETVIDRCTGFLVNSEEELLNRLEMLITSPDIRRSFGVAGRKLSQEFDWDSITREWEQIFSEICARKEHALRT
jgi:glycosyltransferase involved in cell wall biosynthesis